MLSGRLSAKSLARYKLCRDFFRSVVGYFSVIGMQTAEDAARIIDLGAGKHKVSVVGTLKGAQWQPQGLAPARGSTANGKPLLVAGSTHRGEEESLLEALRLLRAHFPTLSLVIAPRHPERFDDVERLLAGSGFVFQRRSRVGPEQWFEKDVLLLDSVGELVNFFAAADVAFIGGSLVEVGGHNVLEPARFGKPILFGPHMENFRSLAADLLRQGAALEVANASEMAGAVEQLLADPARRRHMGERAVAVAASHQRAFEMNLDLAQRYL
jgi:3-deoxy-D-manno-octulosonic-acid transferase